MTVALNLNQLARICTEGMLSGMLEGIAIGLFAWILLQVVGRRNSSTRFAVWFSTLLAIAALPVFRGAASSAGSPQAASVAAAITLPSSWALGVFVVWAVVASVALARVCVGLWQLRKLRASCTVIDATTLDPVLRATFQAFQPVRSVKLCQSDRIQVPTAIGFLKPAVVIPDWAMQELSPAELNSILIHELAHLRRWDDWTNLVQQVLKALLFFHPAVWWIENKLALEREMACDDAVLAETANPRGYAQCLIAIAEKSFLRRGVALAQAAVNRVHQTSLRVSQILDANRAIATRVWKPALYSVAAFSVVCLVSLSHAPELVAFEDPTPDLNVASAEVPSRPLISGTASDSIDGRAVATELKFHTQSDRPATRQGTATATSFVPAHRIQEGTASHTAASHAPAYRSQGAMTTQAAEQSGFVSGHRFSDAAIAAESGAPSGAAASNVRVSAASLILSQSAEHQIREGNTVLVAQSAEYRVQESATLPMAQSAEYRIHDGTTSQPAEKDRSVSGHRFSDAVIAAESAAPSGAAARNTSFSAASLILSQSAEYRIHGRTTLPMAHTEYRIWEGTSLLVPQEAESNSALQPLRRGTSSESNPIAASALDPSSGQNSARPPRAQLVLLSAEMPAMAMAIEDDTAPQDIFVVLQTARYREAGPMLWTICVWRVTVLDSARIPVETRIPAKQI